MYGTFPKITNCNIVTYQQIQKSLNIYPNNPDLIELAISTAIDSGHITDVETYYKMLCKLIPGDKNPKVYDLISIFEKFRKAGIKDNIASSLIKIADELVSTNGLRSHSRPIVIDESESNIDIYCWIEINAEPSKVVEMNMELCEQIAERSEFCGQNTFSIAYRSS